MTLAAAMDYAKMEIDALIDRYVDLLERKIRAEMADTGPEDEDALDHPPDPDAAWRRSSPEEIIVIERGRLEAWREQTLECLRATFWAEGLR